MQAVPSEFLVINRKERANCLITNVLNKRSLACFMWRNGSLHNES
jgi:hypothetical protein